MASQQPFSFDCLNMIIITIQDLEAPHNLYAQVVLPAVHRRAQEELRIAISHISDVSLEVLQSVVDAQLPPGSHATMFRYNDPFTDQVIAVRDDDDFWGVIMQEYNLGHTELFLQLFAADIEVSSSVVKEE